MAVFDSGQVSLRMYPHAVPVHECMTEMLRQATLAEAAGFDGLMTSEHHGGFPGYIPNPLQLAGWLLEATERVWAAPCPLLLPLFHPSHIAEQLAWMAVRFPGRVGAGFAIGGLAQDFEMADLDYSERVANFKQDLPRVTDALRGHAEGPLANDPAIAACAAQPVPVVSAAQSPGAVRRAARLGIGVLYDSLQTVTRMREISDAYVQATAEREARDDDDAEGTGSASRAGLNTTRLAIRRVWIGPAPDSEVEAQMDFYRGYASKTAQEHWGQGDELIAGENGGEVAEKLLKLAEEGGCDAFNLRVHVKGIEPSRVEEQIERLGAETLPALREGLRA